ncbi:epithelial cell-transforming sequence 2 oncogene-like [Acipenser ruthenus]|uniref:epithelial cell-transforming sequence 2 oncogene-like n=1 Tax=Acipenser ruthenus TaxID=7906 RepID=UPI00274103A0|nr:epithelial cell-transforming sequence 2 oncogene-like [Acipenser ruthenus]
MKPFPCVNYFIEAKLQSWCSLADVLVKALKTVRKHMIPYLQELQEEVCGRIIGQFTFDSMGLAEVQTNQDTDQALTFPVSWFRSLISAGYSMFHSLLSPL